MKLFVHTHTKQLSLVISPQDNIGTLKQRIKEALTQQHGVFVFEGPGRNNPKLVFKGIELKDNKIVEELKLEDGDCCLYLYDLKAKPPPPPVVAPAASPVPAAATSPNPTLKKEDQLLIDQIVNSFRNSQKPPTPSSSLSSSAGSTRSTNRGTGNNPPSSSIWSDEDRQKTMILMSMSEDVPFQDPEGLEILINMGFPSRVARKALLLNTFEYQKALDWLLTHQKDPDFDAPLTEAQLEQILDNTGGGGGGGSEGSFRNRPPSSSSIPNYPLSMPTNPAAANVAPTPPVRNTPPPKQTPQEALKSAIANKKCTYTVTGQNFQPQNWYECFTCGLIDNEGVCESCAAICHEGHVLSEIRVSQQFYCDCGHNPQASGCKCCK